MESSSTKSKTNRPEDERSEVDLLEQREDNRISIELPHIESNEELSHLEHASIPDEVVHNLPEETNHSEIASPPDKRRSKFHYKIPKFGNLSKLTRRKAHGSSKGFGGNSPWKKSEPVPTPPLKITMTLIPTNVVSEISLEELMTLAITPRDNTVVWIDFENPTENDMKKVEGRFMIHPLTTEDILNTSSDAREKTEIFEEYVFVVTKEMGYVQGTNLLVIHNINIVVFPKMVLSFHTHNVVCIKQVCHRINQEVSAHRSKQIITTSDWIMYAILDAVTDMYVHHVNGLATEGESLDELVLLFSLDEREDVLRRIGLARHFVINLLSHLWAKRELLGTLTKQETPFVSKTTRVYLRDVLDHTLRMEEKLRVSQEILNFTSSTYLARVSIEAAESSNGMNSVMKRFGATATLFLPLNLLSGLFGMNVRVPAQNDTVESLVPFFVICGFMAFCLVTLLTVFTKKGWL